jgi:hypothetical protein
MSGGTAETEGLRAQPASAARRETPDPIALIKEAAEELDAYYTAENAGDHPHSVTKLAQAKQANPARAALTALQEQPAREEAEALVKRLRDPQFGTETSERNLMASAAAFIARHHLGEKT